MHSLWFLYTLVVPFFTCSRWNLMITNSIKTQRAINYWPCVLLHSHHKEKCHKSKLHAKCTHSLYNYPKPKPPFTFIGLVYSKTSFACQLLFLISSMQFIRLCAVCYLTTTSTAKVSYYLPSYGKQLWRQDLQRKNTYSWFQTFAVFWI